MSSTDDRDSDKTPIFLHPRIRGQLFMKGQELFNDEKFFEAHEEWETLWKAEQNTSEKVFLQGLIQVAAHFVHVQKHRYGPAYRVALTALEKLAKPLPHNSIYLRIDIEPIVSGLHYNLQVLAPLVGAPPDEAQSEDSPIGSAVAALETDRFLFPKLFDTSL